MLDRVEGLAVDRTHTAEIVVLIVGFHNPTDIEHCIVALSNAATMPNFDVLICENGGRDSFDQLNDRLADPAGACRLQVELSESPVVTGGQFAAARILKFPSRPSRVIVGCAVDNLGYAGGINAWLRELAGVTGWKGVWILNPDTEPGPSALAALVARAEIGGMGMVGSTILEAGKDDVIRFRGGIHWQRFAARSIAIGLDEQIGAPFDLSAIEKAMDSPSGASMYVTRDCIEQIGLMDESYFLFFEDLDWGMRAKKLGLGYASASIVAHQRGTTTGSSGHLTAISRLAVYLQHRNGIHFVRRHFPLTLPVRVAVSILHAFRFLLHRAPRNFVAALEGVLAGLKGETGQPTWHRKSL
jgi:N-acetylglucosaminyl-diphospho-decaprenol L-rhamnosyltransferase